MNQIIPFDFEGHAVRVVTDEAGVHWFNAGDVCAVLGYTNPWKAVADHVDEDDLTKREVIDALGRSQGNNHINESGLYALIFGSRKEEARRFKRWVTADVLPTLRQTGTYSMPGATFGHMNHPAPQFITPNPAHAADALTAADRVFRGMLRAGRAAGLTTPAVLRRANAQAKAHTGIDMLAELNIPEPQDPPPPPKPPKRPHEQFIEDWQAGKVILADGQPPLPYVPCNGRHLHQAYMRWWARQGFSNGRNWPLGECTFISLMGRLPGWRPARAYTMWAYPGSNVRKGRKMLIAADLIPTPGQRLADWLTDGYFTFQTALQAAHVLQEASL